MVVDRAGVISPDAIARINRSIFDVKSKYGGEIVVVTLPDIGGQESADVALRIGREWQVGEAADIGARSRNAGLVVLVVPKETASDGRGQIAIQTGRGAEGFITDGTAGEIRRAAIPYLQGQDYSGALELITTRLAERFEYEFGPDSARRALGRSSGRTSGEIPPQAMLALFLFLLVLFSVMGSRARGGGMRGCLYALMADAITSGRRQRGGHWGGGGFGGGSWGGGGGGFGGFGGGGGFSGGGSSGSW
jgi:uncharacterized protein